MINEIITAVDTVNNITVNLTLPSGFVVTDSSDVITNEQVIYAYEQYYDRAMTLVITIFSALIGVFAIGVPLLLNWKANKNSSNVKQEFQNLEEEIKANLAAFIKEELQKSELENKKKINQQIKRSKSASEGAIFHIQANLNKYNERYRDSIISGLSAICLYLTSGESHNLNAVVQTIKESINEIQNAQDEFTEEQVNRIYSLLDDCRRMDNHQFLFTAIQDIEDDLEIKGIKRKR